MRMWRKGKGEEKEKEKVEREESGKLVQIQLSRKSGEPILGFTSPKGEDQARKLRAQAEDLRNMAKKLERIAEEMEGSVPGGKALQLVRKVFQRGGQKKAR